MNSKREVGTGDGDRNATGGRKCNRVGVGQGQWISDAFPETHSWFSDQFEVGNLRLLSISGLSTWYSI